MDKITTKGLPSTSGLLAAMKMGQSFSLLSELRVTKMNYRTGFHAWSSQDQGFANWRLNGCRLQADQLTLAPEMAVGQEDRQTLEGGLPYYNGAAYFVGEADSPLVSLPFPAAALIPSWNADTPAGSWIEVLMQVADAEPDAPWYSLGVWAAQDKAANPPATRPGARVWPHSVNDQADERATVDTDTLRFHAPCASFKLRVRLFSVDGRVLPTLRRIAVTWSDPKPRVEDLAMAGQGGRPELWNQVLKGVPRCSQMVFADQGKAWCSPTAVAMVLGYWRGDGPCGDLVPHTAAGVYDHVFKGHGNWAFNVAWAGSLGFEAQVVRFASLAELEPWLKAQVPVVLSVSWNNQEGRPLANAPVDKSSGHLTLLVGFDAEGNPVMNEPAAPNPAAVRRTYDRKELETRWLAASGGAVYLIYPRGHAVPKRSSHRRM